MGCAGLLLARYFVGVTAVPSGRTAIYSILDGSSHWGAVPPCRLDM